eukprot:237674-Chlamydomonas_euryale.AAC.5
MSPFHITPPEPTPSYQRLCPAPPNRHLQIDVAAEVKVEAVLAAAAAPAAEEGGHGLNVCCLHHQQSPAPAPQLPAAAVPPSCRRRLVARRRATARADAAALRRCRRSRCPAFLPLMDADGTQTVPPWGCRTRPPCTPARLYTMPRRVASRGNVRLWKVSRAAACRSRGRGRAALRAVHD